MIKYKDRTVVTFSNALITHQAEVKIANGNEFAFDCFITFKCFVNGVSV